jgi:cysteine-rich repeat protein
MTTRVFLKAAALALALVSTLTGCEADVAGQPSTSNPVLASQSSSVVGDGRLQPGEQCDDGNTVSGDGCSATGTIESGYLCHVPGRACSLASLCGNDVTNTGEACDDGDTAAGANGCTATCDLSLCGNGVFNNRPYPNFDQEICDDGNRFEGDGCSRQCEVEPGFACAGSPSRCVRAGVAVFNTGVDQNNRRLESGADPHWFYRGTTTGAVTDVRDADDWPQEIQTARYMRAPLGESTCVYQDFIVPSTTNISQFRLRLATFNDNAFDSARVNGTAVTPVTVNDPGGQPWQKNIFREFGTTAPWRTGLNRIELCNENETTEPNAFRYLFVDAYDDRCGDGVVSLREDCDDGDTDNGDGCSATCAIEPGYGCTGAPSTCAQTCGNGALNPGEQCDDGNTTAGDGCNASCRVEAGHACPTPGQACVQTCGNGAINAGEQCDDGNQNGSDGCSAACRIESGYECAGAPSVCAPLCGNSRLDSGELCDDGNTQQNDGCSIACTLELGYSCPTVGQPCAKTCGNGTMNPGEQCDDGNLNPGDGCATECRVEPGYACSTPSNGASVCALTCGNGVLNTNETCDDGNTAGNDGCSPGCRVETGYSCSGQPSACVTLCGDGVTAGAEACDDGNSTAGDGCNSQCTVEPGYSCPAPGNVCFNTCGNGTLNSGEECDDDDTDNGDGCNSICRVESGYSCSGAPSVCRTSCGDGVVAGSEVCDDGNLSGGDTCSPRCLWEVGQTCAASGVCESGYCNPSTNRCDVLTNCGNGALDEGELCDDGNTAPGDGCGASCTLEAGYSCSGNPSVCAVTCGDGVKAASEACDDGNTTAGDGCGATCTTENGYGCRNTGVSTFFTRLGRSQCTQVSDINTPSLPAGAVQAALSVPGRYRMHYVSGAVSYAGASSWYPGIFGVNANPGTGTLGFSQGAVPVGGPVSSTRNAAMALGFPLSRDFDAATGDVRLALVDTDCGLNNNSETAVTYRVDALSICQLIPVLTSPGTGGTTEGTVGGTGSPGATVIVYVDGSNTPACTAVVDATGHWTCDLGNVTDGTHSVVLTSTTLSATEPAPAVNITVSGPTPVDTTPPAAPVITGPAPGSVLSTSTPTLTGTAEPGSTVTVREGNTVLCAAVASDTGTWSCVPTTPMADGQHTVTATATDAAGNTGPPSNTDTFAIDTQAPDTTIPRGPRLLTNDGDASFQYASTEDGVRYECSLDGGAYVPCEDGYDVALGEHTLRVRSVDAAGNVDASPAVYSWTVEEITRAFAGGGCSAAPASSGLALLALLGLRRRNRRPEGARK